MAKVWIDYSDGQYILYEANEGDGYFESARAIEMDDRDLARYQEFRAIMFGWDAFIRDLDQKAHHNSPAYGPQPRRRKTK